MPRDDIYLKSMEILKRHQGQGSPIKQNLLESSGALDAMTPDRVPVTPDSLQRGVERALRMSDSPGAQKFVRERGFPLPTDVNLGGGTIPVPPTLPDKMTAEEISFIGKSGRGAEEAKAPTMRSYESGDEKITEEWDPTGKAWKEVGRSKVVRGQRLGFINEANLRKEFNQHQVVKDFREVTGKYSNMEQAIKEAASNPSSMVAVDQALITMFNKMLDPQSVVRESEYARTPEDIGLFNRLVGKVEKLRSGGAGLTDEERNALVRMARRFYEVSQAKYTETKDFYGEIAAQNGIEPNRVIQTISGVGSGTGNATGGASLPGALPPGVPPGSKQIGTKNGNPVYETPDGKRFMVTP